MNPVLTSEQIQAIQDNPGDAIRVINPQSDEVYVIVRAQVYEQMRSILKDDYRLDDTYEAQMQSALRAGWDDPLMDEYNHYDESFKKLCQ